MSTIPESLRRQVERRADYRCEYCLLPDTLSFYSHEIDHVIARKHGGKTTFANLAYACWRCNRYKGSDLGSFDPETGHFSFLFNPRKQQWQKHFLLQAPELKGMTSEGRVTVYLLKLNSRERIAERKQMGLNLQNKNI